MVQYGLIPIKTPLIMDFQEAKQAKHSKKAMLSPLVPSSWWQEMRDLLVEPKSHDLEGPKEPCVQ